MTNQEIEAKALELYCSPYGKPNPETYACITGALSRQPEIDQLNERVKELEGSHEAFPLMHVLSHLIKATEMLLKKKDYDGPDYEDMERAVKRGKEIQQLLTKNNQQ